MNKKLLLTIFVALFLFSIVLVPKISYSQTTPTPTSGSPTPKGNNQGSFNILLILGIVVAVAVVGAVAALFVMRRRVNEKSLRKFSSRAFQDWVVKRFGGRPGDPTLGVDGYTAGGQPLLIRQSDNVSLPEVDDFVNMLIKGGAQMGTIVAFNYDHDSIDGKLKANDNGIVLEMLSVHQLVNKRYSDKIENIAHVQVTFSAPLPPMTEGQDQAPATFEGMQNMPNEPRPDGSAKPVVFVSFSNTKIVDQVRKMLEFLHYDFAVGDKEETPFPISENKFGLMRNCDCAIVAIPANEQEKRYGGYVLNSNVLTEISAAYLQYNMQLVLLVERKIELPSNLKGLKRIEYDDDDLSFDAAMELEKLLAGFRKL